MLIMKNNIWLIRGGIGGSGLVGAGISMQDIKLFAQI